MRFLQLTRYQDRTSIWINVGHIAYFLDHKQGATIVFNGGTEISQSFEVMESPAEIIERLNTPGT